MDESGAKMNLKTSELSTDDITERLEEIRKEKEQATADENYERAAELRTEELQLIDKQQSKAEDIRQQAVVDIEDIQQLIEAKTGIPVRRLQADEQQKMRDLPDRLNANVIGQDQAVSKVSKAIRRNRAGLRRGTRPIGSFLFAGPTGVGKTELTKQIAVELFGEKDAMIRFDMSEYMEKHAASKLIGSPPGYVGYEEAGQLTERVRRKPYSIILLERLRRPIQTFSTCSFKSWKMVVLPIPREEPLVLKIRSLL